MNDWEIVADNLSKSRMELGLRVSFGFQWANNLDCRCTSRRRKPFRCARRRKAEAFLELESAICVCGEVAAAVLQRNATAAIVNVARVIASCSYHFVVAAWSTKSC